MVVIVYNCNYRMNNTRLITVNGVLPNNALALVRLVYKAICKGASCYPIDYYKGGASGVDIPDDYKAGDGTFMYFHDSCIRSLIRHLLAEYGAEVSDVQVDKLVALIKACLRERIINKGMRVSDEVFRSRAAGILAVSCPIWRLPERPINIHLRDMPLPFVTVFEGVYIADGDEIAIGGATIAGVV